MSRALRLAKILRVIGRYRLDELVASDNLPVSVDSRQFGPISGGQILGQITDSKSVFGFR